MNCIQLWEFSIIWKCFNSLALMNTVWKLSKIRSFSGQYLDNFHAVESTWMSRQVRQPIRLLWNQNIQKVWCTIVGHLSMEISRPTKYLLKRGELLEATWSSTVFRRSPLVQGVLEILFKVEIRMSESIRNRSLTAK